jgi:hypothetical protein
VNNWHSKVNNDAVSQIGIENFADYFPKQFTN